MKTKNPVMLIVFGIFILANVLDMVTAFFIEAGEANPIYLLTQSMGWLVFLKLAIVLAVYAYYRRNIYPSHFTYYMFMLIMILGTLALSLGIYSNIQGILHPEVLEYAASLSDAEKTQGYITFISFIYVIPIVLSLLAFKLYELSLKYIKIDSTYFKKQKWWKRW